MKITKDVQCTGPATEKATEAHCTALAHILGSDWASKLCCQSNKVWIAVIGLSKQMTP